MSYINDLRPAASAARAPKLSLAAWGRNAPVIPASPLSGISTRLSAALEATILVATLSGVSLVMSTIVAGAF